MRMDSFSAEAGTAIHRTEQNFKYLRSFFSQTYVYF